MSHFTAVVVLKDPDDLHDALAPFDEGLEVPPYRSVLNTVAEAAKSARRFYPTHPQYAPVIDGQPATAEQLAGMPDTILAVHWHDDEGKNVRIEGDQVVYDSTYNPQSKWDWFSVGGRWRGFFRVKPGAEAQLGEASWTNRSDEADYTNRADIVRVKDVDWDSMRERARGEATERYDRMEAAAGDAPAPTPWDAVRREVLTVAGIPDDWDTYRTQHQDDGEDWRKPWDDAMADARQRYHSQPWCEQMHKARVWGDPEDYFIGTGGREAYIASEVARAGIPLAVVHDGHWLERGSMGWWGVIRNEGDRAVWNAKVGELFASLDPELWLVAVDCHI